MRGAWMRGELDAQGWGGRVENGRMERGCVENGCVQWDAWIGMGTRQVGMGCLGWMCGLRCPRDAVTTHGLVSLLPSRFDGLLPLLCHVPDVMHGGAWVGMRADGCMCRRLSHLPPLHRFRLSYPLPLHLVRLSHPLPLHLLQSSLPEQMQSHDIQATLYAHHCPINDAGAESGHKVGKAWVG